MSGYRVNEDAVSGLGKLMGRAGDAGEVFADAIDTYDFDPVQAGVVSEVIGGFGGSLLAILKKPLTELQDVGRRNTRKAHQLADACATELAKAAEFYTKTDQSNAKRLDNTYPPARSDRIDRNDIVDPGSAASFKDWENASLDPNMPVEAVTDPDTGRRKIVPNPYTGPRRSTERDGAGDGWPIGLEKEVSKLIGLTSVTGGVRALLKEILGEDPIDGIVQLVVGDWESLHGLALVFEDTSKAFGTIKTNVDRGRYGIQDEWHGNAAGAAKTWLADYSGAAADHSTFLHEASQRITNYARAVYHLFQALNAAVNLLLDLVLDTFLLKGLGDIPGAVAALIRDEGGLASIASILLAAAKITAIINSLQVTTHSLQAAAELIAANAEVTAASWPNEPYDHPGVA